MQINDLVENLKKTTLKNIHLEDDTILEYINSGLVSIYTKFDIDIKEQTLELNSVVSEYSLNSDVMVVTAVYTQSGYLKDKNGATIGSAGLESTEAVSIPLNDIDDPNSVFTPATGIILVPYPTDGQILSILYKASPKTLKPDDLTDRLALGPQYIEALKAHIAYATYSDMDTKDAQTLSVLLQRYNGLCDDISTRGVTNTNQIVNDKLRDRGFV